MDTETRSYRTGDRETGVVLKIHPDGSIMDVRSEARESDASLASDRARPAGRGSENNRSDNR